MDKNFISIERKGDMDRMEKILDQVEERLERIEGSFLDVNATRTELGYIRLSISKPERVRRERGEEITVLD